MWVLEEPLKVSEKEEGVGGGGGQESWPDADRETQK